MATPSVISGLSGLVDDYDVFIIDLWGVMHDGVTAFPEAVDTLTALKAAGKTTIILSNAPRRAESVAARNGELGIDPALCDLVMSSGEEAWRHLKERPTAWYRALGRRCFHLGPDRDFSIREGLDYDFVADLAIADFVLLTGARDSDDTLETYADILAAAYARKLPMVCANPDLAVIRGGRREICAGTLAAGYEALGGEVIYHGKPDPQIYRRCLDLVGKAGADRVLAIGDSLRTDLTGAARSDMDSVFVVDGIHGAETGLQPDELLQPAHLAELFEGFAHPPRAAMARLRWS